MVSILLLVLVLAACCAVWRLSARSPRQLQQPKLWKLACLIGTVRIGALWIGAAGLRSPGWAQVWGYGLLMTGLPEIYFAKGVRTEPIGWAIIGTMILAATSFAWAALVIWVAARLRSSDEPNPQPTRS